MEEKCFITKIKNSNDVSKFCVVQSNWDNDEIQFNVLEYENVDNNNKICGEWASKLEIEELKNSANELNIPHEKFLDECKLVFCINCKNNANENNDNNGSIIESKKNAFSYQIKNSLFTLQKNEKFKCTYIEMKLQILPNLKDQIILDCVDLMNKRNDQLKEIKLQLQCSNIEYQTILKSYNKFIEQKRQLEMDLLSKFAVLLNSKKDKIAELHKILSHNNSTLSDNENQNKTVNAVNVNNSSEESTNSSGQSSNFVYSQPTQKLSKRKQFDKEGNEAGDQVDGKKLPKRITSSPTPSCNNTKAKGNTEEKNNDNDNYIYENNTEDILKLQI